MVTLDIRMGTELGMDMGPGLGVWTETKLDVSKRADLCVHTVAELGPAIGKDQDLGRIFLGFLGNAKCCHIILKARQ